MAIESPFDTKPGQLQPDSGMQTSVIDPNPLRERPMSDEIKAMPGNSFSDLNMVAKRSAEGLKMHQDATGVLEQIQKQTKDGTGFLHHFLAVAAALNGQFGPAIALQEQKRRSKALEQTTPAFAKANEFANTGRYQEAVEFLQKVSANIGDRAPEAQKVFQAAIENISAKQSAVEKAKVWWEIENKSVPKEHPSRVTLDQIGIAIKSGMPFAIDMAQALMGKVNTTVQDGISYVTSENTGKTVSTPVEKFFDIKNLPELARNTLITTNKMTEDQINNIMRGEDSPAKQFLQDQITTLYGRDVDITLGKAIPRSPEFMAAMQQYPGMTTEKLNKGQFSIEEMKFAQNRQAEQSVASKPFDKTALLTSGMVSVNADSKSPDFGSFKTGLSLNETREAGLIPFSQEILTKQIQPTLLAITGLDRVREMFRELSSVKEGTEEYDRVGQGLIRRFQQYANFTPTEGLTVANALRAIGNRSVEEVADTKMFDDATIRELKTGMTGAFAEPVGADKAVEKLQERLREKVGVFIGEKGMDIKRDSAVKPSEIQRQSYSVSDQAATQFKVPQTLARAVLQQESGGGVNTTHRPGDGYGPMQITHNKPSIDQKSTADQISLLINEPVDKILNDHNTNIIAGTAWLGYLIRKNGGDLRTAVRDYNGRGPAAERYADQVMKRYEKESAAVIAKKLPQTITGLVP